jgi:hypothetical protein
MFLSEVSEMIAEASLVVRKARTGQEEPVGLKNENGLGK